MKILLNDRNELDTQNVGYPDERPEKRSSFVKKKSFIDEFGFRSSYEVLRVDSLKPHFPFSLTEV